MFKKRIVVIGTQSTSNLIHTDDELWRFAYEPGREGQSTVWIFQGEEKPTTVIRYWRIMIQIVATVTLENHKDRQFCVVYDSLFAGSFWGIERNQPKPANHLHCPKKRLMYSKTMF